jgi:cell division topological specificity factor
MMKNFLDFFRQNKQSNASLAKERLQIIVAHQRAQQKVDYLPALQKELLAVIKKYVKIDDNQVRVELERSEDCSVLELNITLPERNRVESGVA